MKRLFLALGAALTLSACASGYGGFGGGGLAYYDDYYGPYYDGYWGGDAFYYRHDRRGPFIRDTSGHFRRGAAPGFHGVHAHGGFHGVHGVHAAGGDHH